MKDKIKIGFSMGNIYYDKPDKINMKTVEITTKDPALRFNIKKIIKAKKQLKGKDLSMHTSTSRIFSCKSYKYPEFNEAELNILKAEIILCSMLGAKQLITHLKQEKLTKAEENKFRELLKYARSKGVEIIYESNGFFDGRVAIDVLKRFPKLKYNLDLGHLNTAIENKTLGIPLRDFIEAIKKRIVYIHAHNNNGKDDHKALDDGTLKWEPILDMIDIKRVRKIIIEARTAKDIRKTKKLLEDYLRGRK